MAVLPGIKMPQCCMLQAIPLSSHSLHLYSCMYCIRLYCINLYALSMLKRPETTIKGHYWRKRQTPVYEFAHMTY